MLRLTLFCLLIPSCISGESHWSEKLKVFRDPVVKEEAKFTVDGLELFDVKYDSNGTRIEPVGECYDPPHTDKPIGFVKSATPLESTAQNLTVLASGESVAVRSIMFNGTQFNDSSLQIAESTPETRIFLPSGQDSPLPRSLQNIEQPSISISTTINIVLHPLSTSETAISATTEALKTTTGVNTTESSDIFNSKSTSYNSSATPSSLTLNETSANFDPSTTPSIVTVTPGTFSSTEATGINDVFTATTASDLDDIHSTNTIVTPGLFVPIYFDAIATTTPLIQAGQDGINSSAPLELQNIEHKIVPIPTTLPTTPSLDNTPTLNTDSTGISVQPPTISFDSSSPTSIDVLLQNLTTAVPTASTIASTLLTDTTSEQQQPTTTFPINSPVNSTTTASAETTLQQTTTTTAAILNLNLTVETTAASNDTSTTTNVASTSTVTETTTPSLVENNTITTPTTTGTSEITTAVTTTLKIDPTTVPTFSFPQTTSTPTTVVVPGTASIAETASVPVDKVGQGSIGKQSDILRDQFLKALNEVFGPDGPETVPGPPVIEVPIINGQTTIKDEITTISVSSATATTGTTGSSFRPTDSTLSTNVATQSTVKLIATNQPFPTTISTSTPTTTVTTNVESTSSEKLNGAKTTSNNLLPTDTTTDTLTESTESSDSATQSTIKLFFDNQPLPTTKSTPSTTSTVSKISLASLLTPKPNVIPIGSKVPNDPTQTKSLGTPGTAPNPNNRKGPSGSDVSPSGYNNNDGGSNYVPGSSDSYGPSKGNSGSQNPGSYQAPNPGSNANSPAQSYGQSFGSYGAPISGGYGVQNYGTNAGQSDYQNNPYWKWWAFGSARYG